MARKASRIRRDGLSAKTIFLSILDYLFSPAQSLDIVSSRFRFFSLLSSNDAPIVSGYVILLYSLAFFRESGAALQLTLHFFVKLLTPTFGVLRVAAVHELFINLLREVQAISRL